MAEQRVDCPTDMQAHLAVGEYANAFRIVQDSNQEWFLDFLVHSALENRAKVVCRVRVSEHFMAAIGDRMAEAIQGIKDGHLRALGGISTH